MFSHAVNMMTYEDTPIAVAVPSIDAVIAAHGARKVLAAAVAALLFSKQRKCHPPDNLAGLRLERELSAHMRRDIGLLHDRSGDYRHRF